MYQSITLLLLILSYSAISAV